MSLSSFQSVLLNVFSYNYCIVILSLVIVIAKSTKIQLPRIRHSVLVLSSPLVTENTDPSFSNALLYWMFSDQ